MSSQLGVNVTPVVVRKLARDPLARTQNAADELARAGTLSAVLRIPGAAGPVSVVADLRIAQIRTSVQLDAPPDGGGARRINWIIRQLTDAPDSLAIEVFFARREQTSCEQLKDARTKPATLLPDPAAEIRAFRLTACAPMGTKRNGLSKAFVACAQRPAQDARRHRGRGHRRRRTFCGRLTIRAPAAGAAPTSDVISRRRRRGW